MTLYEMTSRYRQLYDTAQSGEWDDEQSDILDALLGKLTDDAELKLLGIARVVKNLQADSAAIHAEEVRLRARRTAIENTIDRLKGYAQENMEALNIERVKDELFTVALQKNPPSVYVTDESAIPAEWWRQPAPVLDKSALKDALKAGAVPGAELVQTRGIRFR